MRQRWRVGYFVLFIISLVTACSLLPDSSAEPNPSPTATPSPTLTPSPEPSPTAVDAETFLLEGTGEELFDSYEAIYTVEFNGTNSQGETSRFFGMGEMRGQAEPSRSSVHTIMEATGVEIFGMVDGNPAEYTVVFTEDVMYIAGNILGQQTCLVFPGNEDSIFASMMIDVDSYLGDEPLTLTLVSENAEVNGIPARYFKAEHVSSGDLNDASVEAWVSKEGGYTLRIVLHDAGDIEDLGPGEFEMIYEVTRANEAVIVEIPEDC